MYDNYLARTRTAPTGATGSASALIAKLRVPLALPVLRSLPVVHWPSQWHTVFATLFFVFVTLSATGWAQGFDSASVVRKISGLNEKLELTTNSSRILTLDKNIPRVQVNNPELLAVTPLSATQVQISAKKAGVTQVNLWDEDGNIHTVDVMVYGDARELSAALQTQFPHSTIKVYRYSESLVLTGFVDRPDHIGPIMRLAEDYAPKVINNINTGGVQQILLKVKVMEISRTKLRRMATDFTFLDASGGFFSTGVSGLLNQTSNGVGGFQTVTDTFGKAAEFGIVGDNSAFFGFIDWLQQNNVAKILAEPNIVAVSGRPAQFNVGGEIPIVVPQSLGTASIEFKPFGTQVDFLPIVLGNGNIRLEVRPRISEIDDSRSVVIQDFVIPALTVRQVDTAVEMKASQTFAIAGLVQERTETLRRGLPYVSDVPVLGVPFRRIEEEVNEIELLIMVTPEFVDPIDACEAPCGGPGLFTTSPSNHDLYCGGHMEVPAHCNPIRGMTACGEGNCGHGGCSNCGNGGPHGGHMPVITDGVTMPGGVGYDDESYAPTMIVPETVSDEGQAPSGSTDSLERLPAPSAEPMPTADDLQLPGGEGQPAGAEQPAGTTPPDGAIYFTPQPGYRGQPMAPAAVPQYTAPRPYSRSRQPVFMRNASRPNNPQLDTGSAASSQSQPGLIGPVGYDPQ